MKINIFDIDKFVEVNGCPEITNPIYIERNGIPTEDGIFSYEIFGRPASYDRKTIFGYISLQRVFFHPIVFQVIKKLGRKYTEVIQGTKYVSLDNKGNIVDDEVNGETGIDFFYKNWLKIQWKETDSKARSERLHLLKTLKKNEAFITKWLVIPPFLRDINIADADKGKIKIDELNSFYVKILSGVEYFKNVQSSFGFVHHHNIFKIQNTLLEIYEYLTGSLSGKTGILHRKSVGK